LPPKWIKRRLVGSDHFGGQHESIYAAAAKFAAANGAHINEQHQIYLLTNIKTKGYVFNPLSLFWITNKSGETEWVILEIHNTYGERHAHLLKLDDKDKATFSKEFYVSPFFQVAGEYEVTVKRDESQVLISVNLSQGGEQVFTSSFAGRLKPATFVNRIRVGISYPFMTYQVMFRIKFHGIWLWLRRLPVVPRPTHVKQQGM
jgi:DUF1365 family protein